MLIELRSMSALSFPGVGSQAWISPLEAEGVGRLRGVLEFDFFRFAVGSGADAQLGEV